MAPKKVLGEKRLTAEEKKRKEEKEKREKEKERKERKAQLAADRTFGLKNKHVSAKVGARVEELKRDAPTKEAERARAEARAREKKKQKEAEEAAKRELEILMGVRSSIPQRRKVTEGMEGEELAEQLESMGVTAEPKNFVRKTVEVEDDGAEAPKELTEEERKEIIAKIELEKAHAKEAELKAKADVSPFHVDDEGWYDEDEDPFELLKLVAGNKRAVIMPKGHVETEEMET
jgi:hypothetical protein|tara:strand:- start:3548 stop:4246 length:699 start_codon:yes stop_codon:yes gene_type:complete